MGESSLLTQLSISMLSIKEMLNAKLNGSELKAAN